MLLDVFKPPKIKAQEPWASSGVDADGSSDNLRSELQSFCV